MTGFEAIYYDGKTSARRAVSVQCSSRALVITGAEVKLEVPLAELRVDPPLAGLRRSIHLPGAGELQTDDHAAVERLFPGGHRLERMAQRLEGRWRYVLASVAFLVVATWWSIVHGLPLAARLAAALVPPDLEARLGEQTLASLDGGMCRPATLEPEKQAALQRDFAAVTRGLSDGYRYRLELRDCPGMGPNAFALPGGVVVLTDGLAKLAQSPEQVSGVLAHEIGHVRERHGLRMLLQAAGAAAIVATLAGDVASASSLVVTVPTVLLQRGYSRAFEDEADAYALQRLRELGISPKAFAEILQRIENSRIAGSTSDYLSTHPATARRVVRALAAGP